MDNKGADGIGENRNNKDEVRAQRQPLFADRTNTHWRRSRTDGRIPGTPESLYVLEPPLDAFLTIDITLDFSRIPHYQFAIIHHPTIGVSSPSW